MKILKIFGIVVGIHLFALILIFANPGCSSTTTKPPAAMTESAEKSGDVSTEASSPVSPAPLEAGATSSAITFNPDTPAAPAPESTGSSVRFTPTRPNTPVATALIAEPVTDVTPASTYTVKSGDNLWTIARKHNTTVPLLTAANNLSSGSTIQPGQRLIIPQSSAATMAVVDTGGALKGPAVSSTSSAGAASRSGADVMKHVVKSGETLGGIARRYGVRQGELAVANNITNPARIRPGMELVIPGWKGTGNASKAASPASASTPPATIVEPAPAQPLLEETPASPPPVPVIRIDDSAPSPAPKQP